MHLFVRVLMLYRAIPSKSDATKGRSCPKTWLLSFISPFAVATCRNFLEGRDLLCPACWALKYWEAAQGCSEKLELWYLQISTSCLGPACVCSVSQAFQGKVSLLQTPCKPRPFQLELLLQLVFHPCLPSLLCRPLEAATELNSHPSAWRCGLAECQMAFLQRLQ